MDIITRYYLRKAKLDVSDEYHEQISLLDVNELQKATVYMLLAPTISFAIMYGYNAFRQGGGSSSHFQYVLDRARNRFDSGSENGTKWPSK